MGLFKECGAIKREYFFKVCCMVFLGYKEKEQVFYSVCCFGG